MRIAFCAIIKDNSEADKLKSLLKSVVPYVDSIHITANGKETDEIEAITASTRDKYPYKTVDYSYLEWKKDFSEQRNFNFSKVPKKTDYILWLDTDDVLVGGEYLRPLAEKAKRNGKDILFLKYWYGCEFTGEPSLETLKDVDIEHYRERLIRPGVITWKGRLHETPVPVTGQKDNYTKVPYHKEKNPIAIMHTASMQDSMEKLDRNKEILELQLDEEGETRDPRTILYLMKIYAEIGDDTVLKKCIEMGKEYLQKSGWDEERATANDLMAICSTKLGDFSSAVKYLHSAIEEYPYQTLHYIRLAMSYFNLGKYKESKHWIDVASQMDLDDNTAGIRNLKEIKVLFAQMMVKIRYNVNKDIPGAVEAAKALFREQPLKENEENLHFLMDLNDLYDASEKAKGLLDYLTGIGSKNTIGVLDQLPEAISEQPWAIQIRKENTRSRIWEDKEICYFANFGSKHFEKWDGNSLAKGIGGSETAVISLSEKWTKLGYKVTVYGDPKKPCTINGVKYLPWFYYNKSDKFNIFIQWRNAILAPVTKANKFYVDLHDVVAQVDYSEEIMDGVDGIFFKSQYHRDMLPDLPEDKAIIVGNGI